MKASVVVVIVLILGSAALYFLAGDSIMMWGNSATDDASKMMGDSDGGGKNMMNDGQKMMGKEVTVVMDATGFSPSQVELIVGDSVKFINKSDHNWWPASGSHPTHLICPGFDAIGGVKPGETYTHKFEKAGDCPMHDHLKPGFYGKVIIK